MHAIIGDIGNTVTKVCLIDINTCKVKKTISFNTEKSFSINFLHKIFKKFLRNKILYKKALFSSVVPKHEKLLKKFFLKSYKIKLKEIKDKGIKKIVKINIKNKSQVGSDRIANAVGVYKKYKFNSIVLDFGTATTFDVVTKEGVYNGGVIAPGVNLSINSLSNKADKIPIFTLKQQKKVIGKNTLEALRSGFYWGYVGLINNIILKIEKETNKKYKIIFTGGFAKLFKTSIAKPFVIDKNITINGIIEIFKKNLIK